MDLHFNGWQLNESNTRVVIINSSHLIDCYVIVILNILPRMHCIYETHFWYSHPHYGIEYR